MASAARRTSGEESAASKGRENGNQCEAEGVGNTGAEIRRPVAKTVGRIGEVARRRAYEKPVARRRPASAYGKITSHSGPHG